MEQGRGGQILVVEDDRKLAALVEEYLRENGYCVAVEERGDRAVERIVEEQPALVILDLMLPGLDGLSVCRQVRPRYAGLILMLTARGDEVDEIVGLELGADDYLAKPVRPRLLLARVQSLLRRSSHEAEGRAGTESQSLALGRLHIEHSSRDVLLDGKRLHLTTAEYDLLWLLARHRGEVLTRDDIYRELRGIVYDGLDRSIDLRVTRLRRKLGDESKPNTIIKSVRGVGYLLVESL
ncbi:MAG: response regulator [Myxococcota bacterium]|jgi:DNA-binding response OmpR family regulator|nr:response regulator [Myxococcota bacterium]